MRQPLSRYELEVATDAPDAHELVRAMFPGLRGFTFTGNERVLLSNARVRMDDVALVSVRSSGHDIALTDQDWIAVLAPIVGTIEVASGRTSRVARPPGLLVAGTGERSTRLSPDYLGVLVRLPTSLVHRRLRSLAQADHPLTLEGPGPSARVALAQTLRRYLFMLMDEFDRSDALLRYKPGLMSSRALLADLVAGHWLDDVPGVREEAPDPGPAALHRAEQFLRANLANPVSMGDVAAEAGVSVRALQYAFRRHRQTTPYAFLAESRMQKVRDLLSRGRPGETVTALAQAGGIAHLGRFAQAYLRRFGELPSETLMRAQRKL